MIGLNRTRKLEPPSGVRGHFPPIILNVSCLKWAEKNGNRMANDTPLVHNTAIYILITQHVSASQTQRTEAFSTPTNFTELSLF